MDINLCSSIDYGFIKVILMTTYRMGKLTENILGGVKGKIGNLSFANYKGKIIIK